MDLKGLFLWNQRADTSVSAAIEQFKRAIELDPGYAPAYLGLAESQIVRGNFGIYRPKDIYPAAKAAALKALEIDEALGEAPLRSSTRYQRPSPATWARCISRHVGRAILGFAYAKLGERENAVSIVAALTERYRSSYASPVWIALLYLSLDDRPKALRWLNTACDDRDGWLRIIKTSAFFDGLRDTPEFAAVLMKIGLET